MDLWRTAVRLANVEQDLVSARNTLAVQRLVLATALGLPATGSPLEIAGTLAFAAAAPAATTALAQAMAQRPDYLAARNALAAQARRVDIARADRAPVVGAFGSYGGRANTRDAVDAGSAGALVSVPLYEGGLTAAKTSEERAKPAAAQERLRHLELQIRLDVTSAPFRPRIQRRARARDRNRHHAGPRELTHRAAEIRTGQRLDYRCPRRAIRLARSGNQL